ncbi:hypothetical protein, partial [Tamaricihabitans halophyticus]|uniref:hypothetical protein n=1 Tax=Tamaricihabitans halophyticus TaxID=1262583 RepID=UPI001A9FAD2E
STSSGHCCATTVPGKPAHPQPSTLDTIIEILLAPGNLLRSAIEQLGELRNPCASAQPPRI